MSVLFLAHLTKLVTLRKCDLICRGVAKRLSLIYLCNLEVVDQILENAITITLSDVLIWTVVHNDQDSSRNIQKVHSVV